MRTTISALDNMVAPTSATGADELMGKATLLMAAWAAYLASETCRRPPFHIQQGCSSRPGKGTALVLPSIYIEVCTTEMHSYR